ncbi:hypothetical protein EPA93_30105 [Ktedonosporobacter rubrisoli]|uniref:Uncharacterized protein n=1 Tax=Ktedonosporobacter rubrisoli TaxID=2509675 RepID=A0A4P6JWD8_KTERU|nr:anti-sigma factor [Ktedonosporobacter rubrisoli]QBD80008.1 hypothetical protein EPA93_30105 [Ktedonosporobacter rubrisoli]
MECPKCNEQLDDDSVFCGICGCQVAPLYARGATAVETVDRPAQSDSNRLAQLGRIQRVRQPFFPTGQTKQPVSVAFKETKTPPSLAPMPLSSPPRRHVRRATFLGSIFVLLIFLILTSCIVLWQRYTKAGGTATMQAQAFFSDSQPGQAPNSLLKISAQGLDAPPEGQQYAAWIVDEATEKVMALGTLKPLGQQYVLAVTDKDINLLGSGNKLEITLEQSNLTAPAGKIVLSATFPTLAFIHIKHLLVHFPTTPGQIGLLVGLRAQAQLLEKQSTILKQAADNHNTAALRCAAQSIIDIVEGTGGQAARPLSESCKLQHIEQSGDGYGLLGSSGYIANVAAHASLAATQRDSTDTIRDHAHHVITATDNLKGWITTIDRDARNLLQNPGNVAEVQEISQLTDHALNGVDRNDDGRIDPIAGEAGVLTAYAQGQLMASLIMKADAGV